MKKIAGKIAMILILVMLAHSFTGCITYKVWSGEWDVSGQEFGFLMYPLAPVLDLIFIAVIILGIVFISSLFPDEGDVSFYEDPGETETRIYLAGAEHNPLAEYYSAMERINSLSETERAALMEKFNSLPETKRSVLIKTVGALPKAEIAASMERLNALSGAELISVVQAFNSLSEAEFDSLADKLNERANSLPKTGYAAAVAVFPKKVSLELCVQ